MTDQAATLSPFDPVALKRRYAEERARRVRPEGKAQYRAVFEDRPDMLADPFSPPPAAREPINVDVDALVVGAGMSGIMTAAALRKNGVDSLYVLDGAADFGGTWYWNRYPGAQCDTESYIYMPWLEETGYVPSVKYAGGHELFSYFGRLADQFRLREKTLFQTRASHFEWNEAAQRWIVTTDRGDTLRARYVCLGTGSLAQPKLPDIAGIADFKGRMFLTARWDYGYTGGSPEDPRLTTLADKRVAIVGTGCTAIQAVPHLAKWCKHLHVFQRTPSMINERANRPTDMDWASTLTPGWQEERLRNFEQVQIDPIGTEIDMVSDGWTQLARHLADVEAAGALGIAVETHELPQIADFAAMERNRARVANTVTDPRTAATLQPWYNVHCKRPTFHDEFLPTFNRENVTLIDTGGGGIDRVTENGLVADGREYEFDCIIFATGFEALSLFHRTGQFSVVGPEGASLEDKWKDRFSSLHGVFTHGFPNLAFVGQIRDGAGSFNAMYPFSIQARHAGEIFGRAIAEGVTRFDVTAEAEAGWADAMAAKAVPLGSYLAECTPGYLNNEGNADEPALRTALYGGGILEYQDILGEWRLNGLARDVEMTKAS